MRIVFVWITLFFLVTPAFAVRQTYYVRPDDYASGTNDGTSYANAWQGVLNVDFAVYADGNNVTGEVDRDDTLIICGEHLLTQNAFSSSAGGWGPLPSGEGTGEGDGGAVIIDGSCPDGEDGMLWGFHRPAYATWTDEGGGVYSTVIQGNGFSVGYYLQDPDRDSADFGTILNAVETLAEVQNTPGTTYCASCNLGDTLYVRLTDDGNPDTGDRVLFGIYGYGLPTMANVDNSIIRNLDTTHFPQGSNWYGNNITIQNNKILYSGNRIMRLNNHEYPGEFNNLKIYENELGYAGDGIYHNSPDTASGAGNIHIRGNYIHHIGDKWFNYSSADSHAIAFQGGAGGHLIEKNYVYKAGWAMMVYVYSNSDFTDTIWRWNYIKDCNDAVDGVAPRDLAGMGATGDNNALGDLSGNEWYGNVIEDCGLGAKFTFVDEVKFYNNTVIGDYSIGIYASKSVQGVDIINGTDDVVPNAVLIGVTSGGAVRVGGARLTGVSPNREGLMSVSKLTNISFVDGSVEPDLGTLITGAESGLYCSVRAITLSSGSWAGLDAAGIFYSNCTSGMPAFIANESFDGESPAQADIATYGNLRTNNNLQSDENLVLTDDTVVATVATDGWDSIGPNVKAWNNIFYSDGSLNYHIQFATNSTGNYGADFDYNIYYPTGGETTEYWYNRNWSEWQAYATSGEAHSIRQDPLVNLDGTLQSGSPAIGKSGTPIGDLLSPATVWPSAANTNGVLTVSGDEIGAYNSILQLLLFNQPGTVLFGEPTGAVNFNQE